MQTKPKIRAVNQNSPEMEKFLSIKEKVKTAKLNTVCQEAKCPNIAECWGLGTATFMVLGDVCTRACKFCHIKTGYPKGKVNELEPFLLARTIKEMNLDYVVITSVDRDDLPDGGAGHFANCIKQIRKRSPETVIEVLIPDFRGNKEQIDMIIAANPDVIAQNLETVERLTHDVRDLRAGYQQTLEVLNYIKSKNSNIYTKSSLMVGLGEKEEEIGQALLDLRNNKVDFLTIGQYLQPSGNHYPLQDFISEEVFKKYESIALDLGFLYAFAAHW